MKSKVPLTVLGLVILGSILLLALTGCNPQAVNIDGHMYVDFFADDATASGEAVSTDTASADTTESPSKNLLDMIMDNTKRRRMVTTLTPAEVTSPRMKNNIDLSSIDDIIDFHLAEDASDEDVHNFLRYLRYELYYKPDSNTVTDLDFNYFPIVAFLCGAENHYESKGTYQDNNYIQTSYKKAVDLITEWNKEVEPTDDSEVGGLQDYNDWLIKENNSNDSNKN